MVSLSHVIFRKEGTFFYRDVETSHEGLEHLGLVDIEELDVPVENVIGKLFKVLSNTTADSIGI